MENPELVSLEIACVAADLGVQSSAVCKNFVKAGGKLPMPGERAAITVDEADEHVDVVGSSTLTHGGADSEMFTFREFASHASLQDSSGVLDTSGLPLF